MTAEQSREITRLYYAMYRRLMVTARACFDHNESLAEEAVQETFQIACSKASDVCKSPNPEGWLILTLKNVVRNMWRERAATRKILNLYSTANEENAVSEDHVGLRILYEDVADTEEFQILSEMVLERKSHLEMAQEREISVDACKKRVQRAKIMLRKKLLD